MKEAQKEPTKTEVRAEIIIIGEDLSTEHVAVLSNN